MIEIQWEDVIGVLQTCKPYLIALGVLLSDRIGRSVDCGSRNYDCMYESEKEEQKADDPKIFCAEYACVSCDHCKYDRPWSHVCHDRSDHEGRDSE